MNPNKTKQALKRGESVIGTFLFLSDAAVVELAAMAGLDFVIVDMEHSARDLAQMEHMVRAAELRGITPIVRVPSNNASIILRVLELGAQGLVIPMVNSVSSARAARDATRYPPVGKRGSCSVARAADYGFRSGSLDGHFAAANEEVLLIGLIESAEGCANVDQILDEGIDVAMVGRSDIAASIGLAGQSNHPSVLELSEKVTAAGAKRVGTWAGISGLQGVEEARAWSDRGCRFFSYGNDVSTLLRGYQAAVTGLRAALQPTPAGRVSATETKGS